MNATVHFRESPNVFDRDGFELPALDMPPEAKTAHDLCQELTYAANTEGMAQECHQMAAYQALRSLAGQMGYSLARHVDTGPADTSIGLSGYAWMRERGD